MSKTGVSQFYLPPIPPIPRMQIKTIVVSRPKVQVSTCKEQCVACVKEKVMRLHSGTNLLSIYS